MRVPRPDEGRSTYSGTELTITGVTGKLKGGLASLYPVLVAFSNEAPGFRQGVLRVLVSSVGRAAAYSGVMFTDSLVRHEGLGLPLFA